MELKHHFSVPAPVDTTWATFMDLGGVATCFPGATVTAADGERFAGTVKVKLGPIAMLYAGSGTFVERDDTAHHAVIKADGKDKRGNGTAGATVTITLAPSSGSGTDVDVSTDLNVTGKPAQFGRGVMQDVSDKLLGQFVACLEQRFAESSDVDSGDPDSGDAHSNDGGAEATVAAAGSEAAPAAPTGPVPAAVAAPAPDNAPVPATARVAAPTPATARAGDDALDLGATVLPVLLRSYAPQLIAGVVGFFVGVLVTRGRRR